MMTTTKATSSRQPNHRADIRNKNTGTRGTNTVYDKAQGNRGKQLNPNRQTSILTPAGTKKSLGA